MSNYRVFVGERQYDITVKQGHLLVNGDRFHLDMESLNGNGLHMLCHPTRHVEAYLETGANGCYQVQIEGQHLDAEVNLGLEKKLVKDTEAAGTLKAPMPGLIIDVLVQEGDQVEEGETLVIQEAMKMQMKLRAPCSGRISRIKAVPGGEVDKGQILASVNPESGSLS